MLDTGGNQQILIVDRNVAEIEPLRQMLAGAGLAVRAFTDADAALDVIAQRPPHLIIIDWHMPGFTATELIARVRGACVAPLMRLIILSASMGEQDAVTALNLGADDFVTKPYSVRELAARVAALLRCPRRDAPPARLSCGELVLHARSNQVTAQGRVVNLRSVECRLLEFLMSHPGRTFNRNQLLSHVWGDDSDVDERTVDANVQRLRRILSVPGCESCIQTVRGFGYRFAVRSALERN
jgi:two-component system phosphate regulon response regulator PhoB